MPGIDWLPQTAPQVSPVSRSLASVDEMLNNYAARRQQLAIEKARREQEAAQFAINQQNVLEDNRREAERIKLEDARVREMAGQRQTFDAEQKRLDRQAQRETRASEAVGAAQKAFKEGGAQAARPIALAGGLGWEPQWEPSAPRPTDKGPGEDMMEPSPDPTRFKVSMPGGGDFEFQDAAAEGEAKRRGMRAADAWLPSMQETIKGNPKFGPKAAQFVADQLRSGQKVDPNAAFRDRLQFLEGEAGKTRRAAMVPHVPKVAPDLTVLDLSGKPAGAGRSLIEAEKLRDAQGVATGLIGALGDLKKHILSEGHWADIPRTKAAGARKGKVRGVMAYLTRMFETGILSPGEAEQYTELLDTGLSTSPEGAAAALDEVESGVRRRYDARLRAVSVPNGQPQTAGTGAPTQTESADEFARRMAAEQSEEQP